MIELDKDIFIDEKNITFNFIKSGGPGGQNVNKVNTCAELRFDLKNETLLTPIIKEKLTKIAGKNLSKDGILVIVSRQFRTQERNKDQALKRLAVLIQKASLVEKKRKKSKPTKNSIEKRISKKKKDSIIKKDRKSFPDE